MLKTKQGTTPNGHAIDRARINLREESLRPDAMMGASRAELQEAISRLLDDGNELAVRQETVRIDAQREGFLALLWAVVGVVERIDRCETMITEMHQLAKNTAPTKEWYTVDEMSAILGKAGFTVREWCRLGRVNAAKRECGRGRSQEWIISHAELLRIQNEGLLPD